MSDRRSNAPALHKVIRDPVHNLITLDGDEGRLILDLIDTAEFQRLRRIRQLGVGFLTYPGAEHSRFAHSLGVYHVARRMLDTLREHYPSGSDEYGELEQHRKEILVAALLHDLGHGPLSHLFERALPQPQNRPEGYPSDHEGWSEKIILDRLAPILERHAVRVEIVTSLINKRDRKNLLAKNLISSQLDADRMDYLLRDSLAAGPKYGEFDLEWMLHALRIGRVKVPGQAERLWRLCFDSGKAIHVVEEYIQAREFMPVQVYLHKKTRAYEALLKNAFSLATAISDGDPNKVPLCAPALAKMLAGESVTTPEYLSLDDFRIWTTLMDWSNIEADGDERVSVLARKSRQLINREKPYRVLELNDRTKQDDALKLVTRLSDTDLRFSCDRDAVIDLAYHNARYRKSRESDEEEDRVIYFIEPGGEPKPAEHLSPVIEAISGIKTEVFRFYYDETDPKMVERLRAEGWIGTQPDSPSTQGEARA